MPYAAAHDVLRFWFGPDLADEERAEWFKKDPAFDAEIRRHFGARVDEALAGGLATWDVTPWGALARLLLTDVREAVSQLREGGAIDLAAALRPLAENVPSLAIDMDIEEPLTVDDPERAHVLLRCTQEAITNAVRHSGARHLWLSARREGDRVLLRVRDDGRGSDRVTPGNGLRGLSERLRQYGGSLEVNSQHGQGFHLTMGLPVAANAGIRLHGEIEG